MKQEQLMELQMIEQEAEQFTKQSELIEQNISEMEELRASLEELEDKETKKILANLGKKIYIPVEIKDKTLIVEVGNKNFVKKSIPETKVLIDEQLKRLLAAKSQIIERLEVMQKDMEIIMNEIQKEDLGKHEHEPDCKHE